MEVVTLLINGLSLGAVYALVALGFVIVHKSSEVLNFAHGPTVVFGAFVVARTYEYVGFWFAALLGIAGAAVLAVLIERVVIFPAKDAPIISLAILTIGVEIIMNTTMISQIGPDVLTLGQPWGNASVSLGAIAVPLNRVIMFIVALVLIAVFLLVFQFTSWGIAMRAASENRETAELMGLKLNRIAIVAWLIAGALAGIAGIFLTGAPTPGLTAGLAAVALRAFPAAILGGLDSVMGALVGGLLIGLTEAAAATYQDQLAGIFGRGFGDVLPYLVMIVVLLIRPQGLFGSKEVSRA